MPKNYPEEIKLAALELYLEKKTGAEIAETINEQFQTDVKAPTIYAWARQYDWKGENAVMSTKAKEIVKEKQSQRLARLQTDHLDSYQNVREKASSELEHLEFDRAFDAVKALDIGIQGERKTIEGMVNLQFVQDVLTVLVEEISDEDTLTKVANKLKALVQERDDIQ
jgi:transposase-like protein